jgi:gamma-glutamyl-gamma-aminobutyrate hydrolase PuuD
VGSNGSDRQRPDRGAPPPRIGLTTYLETASWGVWNRPAALVPQVYLDAVVAAGGLPMLLPPVGTDEHVLDALDGLLIVGGADLDPLGYDAEAHPATVAVRPERDDHEARLFRGALERDLPVLGVCRGAQLMTVALGGTLHQHLPELLGHDGHRPAPAEFGSSTVVTAPRSLAAAILGDKVTVPCYHHQGLDAVPTPLVATAWAEDGLVEAVELPDRWVLGVQWHPEEHAGPERSGTPHQRLFEAHVAACNEYKERA